MIQTAYRYVENRLLAIQVGGSPVFDGARILREAVDPDWAKAEITKGPVALISLVDHAVTPLQADVDLEEIHTRTDPVYIGANTDPGLLVSGEFRGNRKWRLAVTASGWELYETPFNGTAYDPEVLVSTGTTWPVPVPDGSTADCPNPQDGDAWTWEVTDRLVLYRRIQKLSLTLQVDVWSTSKKLLFQSGGIMDRMREQFQDDLVGLEGGIWRQVFLGSRQVTGPLEERLRAFRGVARLRLAGEIWSSGEAPWIRVLETEVGNA